jgi:lysozyme family protein
MIKNKKLFYGAFAVIGLGAYLVYRFISKTKSGEQLTYAESVKQDVNTATNTIKDIVLPVASYPLKNGSKGSNVVTLQKWLNDKGYASPKLVTDGIFGAKTESAIKLMQETPYEKTISDYISKAQFTSDYSFGQVSQDFYQKFVK